MNKKLYDPLLNISPAYVIHNLRSDVV